MKLKATWKLDPDQDLQALINSESVRSLEEAFEQMELEYLRACARSFSLLEELLLEDYYVGTSI